MCNSKVHDTNTKTQSSRASQSWWAKGRAALTVQFNMYFSHDLGIALILSQGKWKPMSYETLA